jgi:hypothetical protein
MAKDLADWAPMAIVFDAAAFATISYYAQESAPSDHGQEGVPDAEAHPADMGSEDPEQ